MLLTLLSGIFGGFLRLAPELLKFMDRKEDRAHELAMQDKQLEFTKLQGSQKIEETQLQGSYDIQKAQFDAYTQAYSAEAAMATEGGKLVSAINALIRPMVTFGVFSLWAVHTLAVMWYAYQATHDLTDTLVNAWTADDAALLSMIAAFYFVGRTVDKRNGSV